MVRDKIRKAIQEVAPEGVEFSVVRPERAEFGNYSTNAALVAANPAFGGASKFGKNPREVAEQMAKALRSRAIEGVERVEVAGSGFVNFFLKPEVFVKNIETVLENADAHGRNDVLGGKKVVVEYTDPNPFKQLHIGHLMSNTIGESLARILEASGADVKRANYQGDVGLHVAKAIWAACAGFFAPSRSPNFAASSIALSL